MSAAVSFAEQFRNAVSNEIALADDGLDRYIVHVPFTFDDGDHYVVVAKRDGEDWAFTDEGHTLMHLSYTLPNFDSGGRKTAIDRVLRMRRVQNDGGELRKPFTPERAGDALFEFAQAITQVMAASFLSRKERTPALKPEFKSVVASASAGRHTSFNYVHPKHDPSGLYPVDARVNGLADAQAFIFAIGNEAQCERSTATILRWREWGEIFRSVGVFRDSAPVPAAARERFADTDAQALFGLGKAQERLHGILNEMLPPMKPGM